METKEFSWQAAYNEKVGRCIELSRLLGEAEGALRGVIDGMPGLADTINPLINRIEQAFKGGK